MKKIKPIVIVRFPFSESKEHLQGQTDHFKSIRDHLSPDYYSLLTFENVDSIKIEIIECKSNLTPTETPNS